MRVCTVKEYFLMKTEDLPKMISEAKNSEALRDILSIEIIRKIGTKIRKIQTNKFTFDQIKIVFSETTFDIEIHKVGGYIENLAKTVRSVRCE